jgi:hypothetical protein
MQFHNDMAEQIGASFDPLIARNVAGGVDRLQVKRRRQGGGVRNVVHGFSLAVCPPAISRIL